MVRNREEAAQRAEQATTNEPLMCQKWTRELYDAPSAGDQDRDGDADAVDGWLSEPKEARHPGDRNPPRGVPVAWSQGSGNGHRAISLGNGKIRSTDAGGRGKVATVDLDWVEKNWGHTYLGWTETITGLEIPLPEPKKEKLTRGEHIDAALRELRDAKGKGERLELIKKARRTLRDIRHLNG